MTPDSPALPASIWYFRVVRAVPALNLEAGDILRVEPGAEFAVTSTHFHPPEYGGVLAAARDGYLAGLNASDSLAGLRQALSQAGEVEPSLRLVK